MGRDLCGAIALGLVAVLAAGCSPSGNGATTQPPSQHVAAAASIDETLTAGTRRYRLRADFMDTSPDEEAFIATLDLWDYGDTPVEPEDIAIRAYGSDGRALAHPEGFTVGISGAFGGLTPAQIASAGPDQPRVWGDLPYVFAIRADESSLTVEVIVSGQVEGRWRVR